MRHVSNMDVKLIISIFEALDQHGIIKVAGGFAVNGDDRKITIINAPRNLARGNDGADGLRLFQRFRRKDMADVVLADDDLHIHAKIIFIAQDFHDPSARVLGGGGHWMIETSTITFSRSSQSLLLRMASSPSTRCGLCWRGFLPVGGRRSRSSAAGSSSSSSSVGYSIPSGMMISFPTFSSMGAT